MGRAAERGLLKVRKKFAVEKSEISIVYEAGHPLLGAPLRLRFGFFGIG